MPPPLLALWLGACAGSGGPPQPPPTPVLVEVTERLAFYSDPWINLHHFLYQWARAEEGLGQGRQRVSVPEREGHPELSAEERAAWERAVDFYRGSVAERHHFSNEMLRLKNALLQWLGDSATAPSGEPPDVIPGVGEALATAMPVYLHRWWPGHDRANRARAGEFLPLLRRYESRYVSMTRRAFGAKWPDTPLRVDLSAYANSGGGYTSSSGHVVLYSTDPGLDGLYALEILLHEVLHPRAIGGSARSSLSEAFEEAGVEQPRNLWHAVIFATAGEFVRDLADREGRGEHIPYWIREGFDGFRGWSTLVPVVNEHWIPVVRSESGRDGGFRAMVEAIEAADGGS